MRDNIKDITSKIEDWIERTPKDIARNLIDSYQLRQYISSTVGDHNCSVEDITLIYKEIASRDVRRGSRAWLISGVSAEKMVVRQMALGVLQVSLLTKQCGNRGLVKGSAL